jgi:hypothetical protein
LSAFVRRSIRYLLVLLALVGIVAAACSDDDTESATPDRCAGGTAAPTVMTSRRVRGSVAQSRSRRSATPSGRGRLVTFNFGDITLVQQIGSAPAMSIAADRQHAHRCRQHRR